MIRRLSKFVAVGGAGFLVDASLLQLLAVHWQWTPVLARCVSFPCALAVTWMLNSRFTFSDRRPDNLAKAQRLYVVGQCLASLANFALFSAIVHVVPATARAPILPLAAGACLGLAINYLWSQRVVFVARGT